MDGKPAGPGRVWYWIAALLVVGGMVAGVALGARGIAAFARVIDGMERISIPGSAQVDLDEGGHVVYFESRGAHFDVPEFGMVVAPAAGGAPVEVQPYTGSLTYTSGGVSGTAVYTFRVAQAGPHEVRVSGPEGAGTVALGPSIGGGVFGLVGGIVGAFSVVGLTFMAALVIVIVVAIRRSRARAQPPAPVT